MRRNRVTSFLPLVLMALDMTLRACNDWEKAEKILSMMRLSGITPNEVTYTALISICGRSGDVHQAFVSKIHNALNGREKIALGRAI